MGNGDGKKRLAAALEEARRVEKELDASHRHEDDEQANKLVIGITQSRSTSRDSMPPAPPAPPGPPARPGPAVPTQPGARASEVAR